MARSFGIELEYYFPPDHGTWDVVKMAARATKHKAQNLYDGCRNDHLHTTKVWSLQSECGAEITTPALKSVTSVDKGMKVLMKGLISRAKRSFRNRNRNCVRRYATNFMDHAMDKNTGLHVHVDVNDIKNDPGKLITLAYFFSLAEPYFMGLQPVDREHIQWARPIATRFDQFRGDYMRYSFSSEKIIKPREWEGKEYTDKARTGLRDGLRFMRGKSTALSLGPIYEYGTVEFRVGASTLNPEDVVCWSQICRNFVSRSIRIMKKKKKGIPQFKTFESFLNFVGASQRVRRWAKKRAKTHGLAQRVKRCQPIKQDPKHPRARHSIGSR